MRRVGARNRGVEVRRDSGGLVARAIDARRFDIASQGQIDDATQTSAALGFNHGRWRRRSRLRRRREYACGRRHLQRGWGAWRGRWGRLRRRLRRLQIVELPLEFLDFRLVALLDIPDLRVVVLLDTLDLALQLLHLVVRRRGGLGCSRRRQSSAYRHDYSGDRSLMSNASVHRHCPHATSTTWLSSDEIRRARDRKSVV